jgi:hypothetical protein
MTCSSCDTENEDWWLFCRSCRTLFAPELDGCAPPAEGERVLDLLGACELILAEYWSLSEFRFFVEEFQGEQQRREAGIREIEIPFGLEQEFAEELEVGMHGVDLCNLGLTTLASYDSETDSSYVLMQGVLRFMQGIENIREAMKINRRSYGRPLWI